MSRDCSLGAQDCFLNYAYPYLCRSNDYHYTCFTRQPSYLILMPIFHLKTLFNILSVQTCPDIGIQSIPTRRR